MSASTIKEDVRTRDNFRCTECGMMQEEHIALYGKRLEVHRKVPGSPYTLEGCVTLCRTCHYPKPRRRHGQRQIEEGISKIPSDLMWDIRIVASVLGESVPEYIARVVREALKKDMPRAAKLFAKQAENAGQPEPEAE